MPRRHLGSLAWPLFLLLTALFGAGFKGTGEEGSDFSFVYVAIDRSTKKTELYLKRSSPASVPTKLTDMNTEYEHDPRPAVSTDNLSALFTHTSDWPNMYRIAGLDQPTPSVTKWADNTGSAASFFPDQDKKVVFIAPLGVSLRSAKYDGSESVEEAAQDVGLYYGASASPTLDKGNPFYDKVVFSFASNEDKSLKPHLFVKESGVVYPFLFKPLTATSSISETWPAISPDAKRIAYIRDGYLALCDLHEDDKTNSACDNDFAFAGLTADTPCWTADGSRIVFSTKRDGNAEIYSVSAANADDLENLTNSPDTDDVQPACFPNPIHQARTTIESPVNPQQPSPVIELNQLDWIKK